MDTGSPGGPLPSSSKRRRNGGGEGIFPSGDLWPSGRAAEGLKDDGVRESQVRVPPIGRSHKRHLTREKSPCRLTRTTSLTQTRVLASPTRGLELITSSKYVVWVRPKPSFLYRSHVFLRAHAELHFRPRHHPGIGRVNIRCDCFLYMCSPVVVNPHTPSHLSTPQPLTQQRIAAPMSITSPLHLPSRRQVTQRYRKARTALRLHHTLLPQRRARASPGFAKRPKRWDRRQGTKNSPR
ncbi:hypothetical protein P154DRAFT_571829 [Amniculicola lignicola CBS 123094]|uniref:Uncharacterized protein n=1 Tax=Amniculicola lignicola CBS 123094 TaxID=1392246 RepID=A0A6A5WU45_9PLEO|nr:hypothetical protein P154DRAFT_571829 [Amniculicola lignicola CBS 123094]